MRYKKLRGALPYILLSVTALAISIAGIITRQEPLRIIPLYVSLVVGLLQSRASRYASLIGGINATVYALVYYLFGLYASAASALLISSPIQILTFIRWSKHPYKHSTYFRRLSLGGAIFGASIFLAAFALLYAVLSAFGSSYRVLDLTVSLISIFTSVLTLLSFVEYSYTMLLTGVFSILLDVTMMREHPAQITFLIYSIYSMICIIRQFLTVNKLYSEQRKEEQEI